jgi:hypothetical protein
MAKIKAHIVFDDDKVGEPESRAKMLDKIKQTAQISDVNEERFDLYGILTGTLDDSKLEKVKKIPGVASVEADEEKYTS